jgi:hypothetical protein
MIIINQIRRRDIGIGEGGIRRGVIRKGFKLPCKQGFLVDISIYN